MSTKSAATLAKGLNLLSAIIADGGRSTLSAVAERQAIPLATAHRLAHTLEVEGFLARGRKGYMHCGEVLAGLSTEASPGNIAAARLRRPLAGLARRFSAYAHFGVFDQGMVTYLVRERGTERPLFTVEQMQLEAYCSAIGKILLAALPGPELEDYLAGGPFVALTERTITDPEDLRREIEEVAATGVAFDRLEVRGDLFCVAVPVQGAGGRVIGGVSVSLLDGVPSADQLATLKRQLSRVAGMGAG